MESLKSGAAPATRKWAELTPQEEEDKLKALGSALKEMGLTTIQPVSADHQVNMINSGFTHK